MNRLIPFLLVCILISACNEPNVQEYKTDSAFQPFQPPIVYNEGYKFIIIFGIIIINPNK